MPTVTALMSVYKKTNPEQLQAALRSLIEQTRPADAIVIVEDGPLSTALYQVLDDHVAQHTSSRRIALATNQGLGSALRAGLSSIDTDFVARLDSDDIAAPHRFATQLQLFSSRPELDVIGSAVAEFTHTPGDTDAVRSLPETHAAIARYMKINNPINHPSVMMRVGAVKDAGGYRDIHFMEDYDLFARMLAAGHQFHNIAEPLTYFRVSDDQFARRTARGMWRVEKTMQHNLVRYGLISKPRAVANFLIRSLYRLLPFSLLKRAYSVLFNK